MSIKKYDNSEEKSAFAEEKLYNLEI